MGANSTIVSHNIFAYCENDVVNKTDDQGCAALADDVVYVGIAVLVIITVCIIYCHTIKKTSWSGIRFNNWISKIISAARYIPALVV